MKGLHQGSRETHAADSVREPRHRNPNGGDRAQNLSSGGLSYLQELIYQYLTISNDKQTQNGNAEALARNIANRQSENDRFTWNDVHAMELAMVELLSEDDLRAWASSLRQDCIQAGQGSADSLFAEALMTNNSLDSLRAFLRRRLLDLHRSRTLQRAENEIRKHSLQYALLGFVVIGLCVPVIYLPSLGDAPTHAFVLLFGALGGLISIMHRIRTGQSIGVSSVISYDTVPTWQFMLSPMVGAVGGVLIYLAFQANILGRMNFDYTTSPINGAPGAAHAAGGVARPPELAYLLIWAFFAGFSERLLPDSLDLTTISGSASSASRRTDLPVSPTRKRGDRPRFTNDET